MNPSESVNDMRIVTWNVASLRARIDYVAAFLDRVQPDILCLQEIKLLSHQVPTSLFTTRGYDLVIHGQPKWNGVLIASRFPISDPLIGFDGEAGQARFVGCRVGGIQLVNLYCPQGDSVSSEKFTYKKAFYDRLLAWTSAQDADSLQSLVMTGDFNIAPRPTDVWDPELFGEQPSRNPQELARWAELCDYGLEDVGLRLLDEGAYTFWDYRGGSFQKDDGMRIDHFLLDVPLISFGS